MNEYFTVKEVAKMLAVNAETIRRWIRRGELQADDIGGNVGFRITMNQLESFLKDYKKWDTSVFFPDKTSSKASAEEMTMDDIADMGFSDTLKDLFTSNDTDTHKNKKIEIMSKKNELMQNRMKLVSTINLLKEQLLIIDKQLAELSDLDE